MDSSFNAMKTSAFYYSAILVITVIVASCLPDPLQTGEMPTLESKMVISSQMLPRRGLTIIVTRSLDALDAGSESDLENLLRQIVVQDAVAILHYGNQTDTLLNLGNGVYEDLNVTWREGVRYTLNVKSETLGEVSSDAMMIPPVPFDSVTTRLVYSSIDSLLQTNFTFTDRPGKNYYVVSVQEIPNLQDPDQLLNPPIFNHLIDDTGFDGQEIRGQFTTFYPRFSRGDSVAVFLSTVSAEYYNFLQMRNDDRYNLATFASEPLRYPTNVQGGYGFFNLHLPSVRLFRVR